MNQGDSKREVYGEGVPKEDGSAVFYGQENSSRETVKFDWENSPEATIKKPLDILSKKVLDSIYGENRNREKLVAGEDTSLADILKKPEYQKRIHEAEVLVDLVQQGRKKAEVVKEAQKAFADEPHFLDYFHDRLVACENSLKK